jgi:hypothetical protein
MALEGQVQTIPTSPVMKQALADGLIMMSPAQMISRVKVIDEIRREVMQENTDYYSLQNRKVKKPDGTEVEVPQYSLSKAGGEKLCLTFGLSSEIDTVVVLDDPNAARVIQVPTWVTDPTTNKRNKVFIDQAVTGAYEVKSSCSIYAADGRRLAKASGNCNSTEAAFRSTPYSDAKNGILKRSEKRAYVAAVLMATASSGMFTQDLEDMLGDDHAERVTGGAQAPSGATGGAQGGQTTGGGAQTQHEGPKAAWLTENMRKLVWAKGNKRTPPADAEVIKHVIASMDKLDRTAGKPFFDGIADGSAVGERIWETATKTVADEKAAKVSGAPAQNAGTPPVSTGTGVQTPPPAATSDAGAPPPPPPASGDGF